MNLEGKLLNNRYEIIKQIGVGGMATVYKAKCNVLNRYVAIKVLRDEFTTDAEFIKKFNVEAQSAASLTHPNIVGVYDVANDGNLYYIVMELIKGKTLKEIIDADGILPWRWSVNVAIQIASALEVAHKNNIVHRDIKPHNIIITEDGVAKVTDFGIAKAVSNSTITAFGSTMGSVHYFSPEHAKGGYTDAKSDIYSLGVVLYEMLTGKVPFDADTPVSIALKHMQEEMVEPVKLNPNIPLGVNQIIKKAMQKDANLRYVNASEMLVDLKEALKDPDGTFVRIDNNDMAKTQRVPIIKTSERDEDETEEDEEQSFFKRHKAAKIALIAVVIIGLFLGAVFGGYVLFNKKAKEVQIPNLISMHAEEAQNLLKELKLEYKLVEEKYDDEVPVDQVISQNPPYKENYKVLENSIIEVVVSKGKETVIVPKLTGLKLDEVLATLEQLGLVAEVIEENNDKVEEGYVIKQEPAMDTEVPGKSTVKVYASIGVKTTTIPDVLGKTQADAEKLIKNAKLKLGTVKTETDTTKDDGIVLRQSIESGKEVEENTEIIITINSLPKIKKGTVNINVVSFTGFKEEVNEDGEVTNSPKDVEVMVKITSQGTEDTVYKKQVKEDLENLAVSVEGIGNITVKVFVGGVLKKTEMFNLNQEKPVLNVAK